MEKRQHQLQAKYCYNMLNMKTSGDDVDRLGSTLFNSKINLTPHQIQAALFAFKTPLSRGVLLADEVGLGKTIEAGIIISQLWHEGKKNILVVAPASLLRQWDSELEDKFHMNCIIMDRKMYNQLNRQGYSNPYAGTKRVVICSYQMCSACKEDIRHAGFDYVILDEAHKLRNVYNERNVTSNNVKYAIEPYKKALLTATPIQNNLMDIYGLSMIIDENIFGDRDVFKYNYLKNYDENYRDLEGRLKTFVHRTLRNQVEQYVRFTRRIPHTFTFKQTPEEKEVYDKIIELIQDENGTRYIIPNAQKHLLLLVLCKLMGSSINSVTFTMHTILERLNRLKTEESDKVIIQPLDINDLDEDDGEEFESQEEVLDFQELEREIERVKSIISLAEKVNIESKYVALKESLEFSFSHLKELGANKKVIIFTESKRTQEFLKRNLTEDGYKNILTYNGSNNDPDSQEILKEWLQKPENEENTKNTRSVNMKAAILEKFKDSGEILIATEAGAEGLNLQFCSLVINYDLPWNPQRVEQRIGRCHRFGQQYDVVVINFINSTNVVENRVYELLNNKFHLFDEIFGSSDEVLGKLNDGKDIENEIIRIYSSCRTNDEINDAFDELQEKYKDDIADTLEKTKSDLLENFDEDVQGLFDGVMDSALESISKYEQLFWRLTKCVLDKEALFDESNMSFLYRKNGYKYCLLTKNNENTGAVDYGQYTELGSQVLLQANQISEEFGSVKLDITNYPYNISNVKEHLGDSGFLSIYKLVIESFEQEEYMVINGIFDNGTRIDEELCEKFLRLDSTEEYLFDNENFLVQELRKDIEVHSNQIRMKSQERNNQFLKDEIERINAWADDKIQATELAVENLREQRKLLQKESDQAINMKDKEEAEKKIQGITRKIKNSWIMLGEAEEEVEESRNKMIEKIRKENMKVTNLNHICTVRFEIV